MLTSVTEKSCPTNDIFLVYRATYRMPFRRRYGLRRRPVFRRRRFVRRRRPYIRRRRMAHRPSTVLYNRVSNAKVLTVSKTVFAVFNYVPSSAAGGVSVKFDPSGLYGTNTVGQQMPDWFSFVAVFDQYRVNSVKLTWRIKDTSNAGTDCLLWGRYNSDGEFPTPALTNLQELPNVKMHTFTNEAPYCSWTIYPRVRGMIYNGAGTYSTAGRAVHKMQWTDVDAPTELWGYVFYFTGTDSTQTLSCDFTFNVSFKYAV